MATMTPMKIQKLDGSWGPVYCPHHGLDGCLLECPCCVYLLESKVYACSYGLIYTYDNNNEIQIRALKPAKDVE